MAINIFEGARRIAKLVALVWVLGIGAFILMQGEPDITGIYYISVSDKGLGAVHPSCRYQNHFRQDNIRVKTRRGTEADVTLCFPPETKEFLVTVPSGDKYAVTAPVVATEKEVMAYVQSEEAEFEQRYKQERSVIAPPVSKKLREQWRNAPIILNWEAKFFAEHIQKTLVLSPVDEEWIENQWWSKRWEQARQGLLIGAAGVMLLWGGAWAIGWIVRGFLGIPRGQDHGAV